MSEENNKLTFNDIEKIFFDCLFRENELINGKPIGEFAPGEGISRSFGFHVERLQSHQEEIYVLINKLPNIELGISFLDLCMISNKSLWEEHINIEQLIALGNALGYIEYLFPKEAWQNLPGKVPFIIKTKEMVKRLEK